MSCHVHSRCNFHFIVLLVKVLCSLSLLQELYGVRSDLGNLFKALGRLEDAKVSVSSTISRTLVIMCTPVQDGIKYILQINT